MELQQTGNNISKGEISGSWSEYIFVHFLQILSSVEIIKWGHLSRCLFIQVEFPWKNTKCSSILKIYIFSTIVEDTLYGIAKIKQ